MGFFGTGFTLEEFDNLLVVVVDITEVETEELCEATADEVLDSLEDTTKGDTRITGLG